MLRSSRIRFWLLLALLAVPNASAKGQWKMVAPKLTSPITPGGAMCFQDGIVWIAIGDTLYRSNDTGLTWTSKNLPTSASEIQFWDSLVGVIAGPQTYRTIDGGNSWDNIGMGSTSAVFLNGPDNIVIADLNNQFEITTDGGMSWAASSSINNMFGFCVRSKYGTAYGFAGAAGYGTIFTSSDQGQTWLGGSQIDWDSYSFAIDSCDPNRIYLSHEDVISPTDNFSKVFLSTDRGSSWQTMVSHPQPFFCGSVAAGYYAVYCQTVADGVFRSTDRGMTWSGIGGPSITFDTRLIAAINDNLLLAMDQKGNLWRTDNSGGDSVNTPYAGNGALHVSPDSLFVQDTVSCDTLTHTVSFLRSGCPPRTISSWSISGHDSQSFTAGNFSYDSASVTIHGLYPGRLHAGLILGLNDGSRDTVTLDGYVRFPPNILRASPASLFATDTISCDSITRTVTFTKAGCSPPSVSSYVITGTDSINYRATDLSPDSLSVTMYNLHQGNQQAQLLLTLDNGSHDTVELAGVVHRPPDTLIAAPASPFESDTISCDSFTHTLMFHRSGCEPPSVAAWSVTGSDSESFSAWNVTNDSMQVTMYGTKPGLESAQLILTLDNGSSDTVTLSGYVRFAPTRLSVSVDTVFASDTVLCGSLTRSIPFIRTGCSPQLLSVVSAFIVGSDSMKYRTGTIASDSMEVTLLGTENGSFTSHVVLQLSNGTSDTVALGGIVNVSPKSLTFSTQSVHTDTIGGSVSVPITINGLERPENVTLVLHYDGSVDYLGSFSRSGTQLDVPGDSSFGRSVLSIAGATSGAVAAYAKFNVFNDSNDAAHATFDSMTVLTQTSPCEYSTPSPVSSRITTLSGCGITILSQWIRKAVAPTLRIVPNPAREEITMEGTGLENASVEIYDALGRTADVHSTSLQNGFILDVSSLPGGIYFLRVLAGGFVETQSVAIER